LFRESPTLVVLACAAAAGAGAARADEPPQVLEDVIVLAQKLASRLDQLPVPLSTLSGAELVAAGLHDIKGIAGRLPMLDYQESVTAATATLRIRRVGNIGNIPTFEPAVGYFEDGAYRSRSFFAAADLLDVQRVEILRGPQTSLYGKNTGAGVVAAYTRVPGDNFEGQLEVTGGALDAPGSPGLASIRASLDGPIAGGLHGGIAVSGERHGATLRNVLAGGADGDAPAHASARGQLALSPTERFSLRLIGAVIAADGDEGESDTVFVPGARSSNILAGLQSQNLAGTCPGNLPRDRNVCSVYTNHLDLKAQDATLIADYRLANGWLLHSLTGYEQYRVRRDEDDVVQLLAPILFFHDSESGRAWQQELRLSSTDDAPASWVAGLFWHQYTHERGSRGRRPMFGPNGDLASNPYWTTVLGIPFALPNQQGLHDSRQHTDYLAAYGQFTVPLGNHIDVTAAARVASESTSASITNSVTVPGLSVISRSLTPATSPTGMPVNGSVDRASDAITWNLTPRLTLDENRMLYATWARGGKFGGFNTGFGNAPLAAREFGDETIDHLEAGGRLRFAGGRGRLSASAFSTRYHDYQDAAFMSAQFSIGNVQRVDLDGAEVEAEYLFRSGAHVNFSLSYADFTYAKNTTGMCYPGRIPNGSVPGACDLSGDHPVDAPLWETWLGVEQPFTIFGRSARVRLDWNWTDRYNTSFSADPRLVQGAGNDVALRVSMDVTANVTLELAGENLLNETQAMTEPVLNFFNDASYQTYLTEPRRYMLTLRAKF
jgi:outer membrane receptor protein involved in Fe transport